MKPDGVTIRGHRLPWVVAVGDIVLFGLALAAPTLQELSFIVVFGCGIGSMSLVGAVLLPRAPENRVGPLLLASGTILSIDTALGAYASVGLSQAAGHWPGAVLASLANDVLFMFPLVLMLIGVPLIFPDGHLLSRRWRLIVWLTVAAMAELTFSTLVTPGPIGIGQPENPLGIQGMEPMLQVLDPLASLSAPIGFGGAALAVAIRFRRGRGIERQQLKWFLAVAGASAIAFSVGALLPDGQLKDIGLNLSLVGLSALPVAIGIAILRYRLYEIDRLVSRTISYAVITGGLILVFLVVNLALTTAFGAATNENSLVVAISTLVVAALFTPLRRRVQRVVDHRFDRARYDAERTAAAFSQRLRDEVDLAAVVADLDSTVRSSIAPTLVGLWLREGRA